MLRWRRWRRRRRLCAIRDHGMLTWIEGDVVTEMETEATAAMLAAVKAAEAKEEATEMETEVAGRRRRRRGRRRRRRRRGRRGTRRWSRRGRRGCSVISLMLLHVGAVHVDAAGHRATARLVTDPSHDPVLPGFEGSAS